MMPRNPVDPRNLKRVRPQDDEDDHYEDEAPASVSAGPIDKVIELTFNPTREKIREVTIIDRMQGRLFPIMDIINSMYRNCIEVAAYRQSKTLYKEMYKRPAPKPLDVMEELIYRTAQWQKSVAGKNLERATDIALAETETRTDDGKEPYSSGRGLDEG